VCTGTVSTDEIVRWSSGRAAEECKLADGRELWVLAEMYEVEGMKEWLLEDGIDQWNLLAAYEFGLVPEGYRDELKEKCESLAQQVFRTAELLEGDMGILYGAGANAVRGIVEVLVRNLGRRARARRIVCKCCDLVRWWWLANGLWSGCDPEEVDEIRDIIDFTKLSSTQFDEIFQQSVIFGDRYSTWASGVAREIAMDPAAGGKAGDFLRSCTYGVVEENIALKLSSVGDVAVHGEGAEQRVAAVDFKGRKVLVYEVESGECVATVRDRDCHRLFSGVAFNTSGELFVSDHSMGQILVFDRKGALVRRFGKRGSENGQFNCPSGLAFNPKRQLVVADMLNNRVQVLKDDGTFVCAFGSKEQVQGPLDWPEDLAVREDGTICVTCPHRRSVQVFDQNGVFVMTISTQGTSFSHPKHIAVGGKGGNIFICDVGVHEVLEFDGDGMLVQKFGTPSDRIPLALSRLSLNPNAGLAVDAKGRLFVGCNSSSNSDRFVEMLV
jgi:sugar lactone lactonase YvrE